MEIKRIIRQRRRSFGWRGVSTIKLVALLAGGCLLSTLFIAIGEVGATTTDYRPEEVPEKNWEQREKSGWSEWIGDPKATDEQLVNAMYCGDSAVTAISIQNFEHGISESVQNLTAMNLLGLECGDNSYHETAYGTERYPGYSTFSLMEQKTYDPVVCDNGEVLAGVYFTVFDNSPLDSPTVLQGVTGICRRNGENQPSDHSGLYAGNLPGVYYEGISCKYGHQVQAVKYSMLPPIEDNQEHPIISAVQIKCG